MIDFASAHYLGISHPSARLGRYAALTTGVPAALADAPEARRLAAEAAAMQGCEAAMVAPSTLHLAIDVFDRLGRTHALVADETLYPVMRWGLERMRGLGVTPDWYRHGSVRDLAARLRAVTRPPAVISDATRHGGVPVPLARLVALAAGHAGLVVIDHTQVLGLLGAQPTAHAPWGHGGGGLLQYAGLGAAQPVLLLASWAKAFGAPLATLCGPAALVQEIARDGPTQSHCSPASQAALLAGLAAVDINRQEGDARRLRLLERLRQLRAGLLWLARTCLPDLQAGLPLHPVQQLRLGSAVRTRQLHAGLRAHGLRSALLRQPDGGPALALIVRADHDADDIDALLAAMAAVADRLPAPGRGAAPVPFRNSREGQHHVQDR